MVRAEEAWSRLKVQGGMRKGEVEGFCRERKLKLQKFE